jgi:N-acetylmuramoyl-L-alanine amidase
MVSKTRPAAVFLFLALCFGPLCPGQAPLAEVYNLRHYTHPNFTRIVVDVGTLREYFSAELRDPQRIYIDIYQAKLNPILREEAIPVKCDYISLVRISQKNPSTVRVVAEVDLAKVERYQVFHVLDPFRVVIDIYPRPGTPTAAAGKPPQAAQPAKSGYSMARQLGLGIKTVVLDPGHGGSDPGCLDSFGQQEKDTALDISLRLKELLRANSELAVILIRETDIHVPLENRTVIANQNRADIFISVHVNAFRKKDRRGVETFYLNFSPDPGVNELAAQENATTTKTVGEMDKIIKKIVQNSKIIESKELAQKIQENLVKCLSRNYTEIKDLGTKGGPFWVLIGSEMPSILVEVSHLSNAQEAQRLKSGAYRQQIAQGIFEGIMAYIQSLGKG